MSYIDQRNKLSKILNITKNNQNNINKLSQINISSEHLTFHKISNEITVYNEPYDRNSAIYLNITFNNLTEKQLHWIYPYSILENLKEEIHNSNYNLNYIWHQYLNQYILFIDYANIYDTTINSGNLVVKLRILNPQLYRHLSILKIS